MRVKKKPLKAAAVIHQARMKLHDAINALVVAGSQPVNWKQPGEGNHRYRRAEARVERAISIYTRTVRRTK